MTDRNVFIRNKLFIKQSYRLEQYPKELDRPSKLILGQQISIDDPFERFQMPSFGIPAPVHRIITSFIQPTDPNWDQYPVETALGSTSTLDNDVQRNDLYLDTGEFKLANFNNIEDSPRGPHLEILMNYLESLAAFHGITMPKFQLYKEENDVSQQDLNPVGGSSFDHILTTADLSTFKLSNRIWYIKDYITQIQDWLDLFAKELGFTKGHSMCSWFPRLGGLSISDYITQNYNKTFKENIREPNERGASWTPKNKEDLGKYGKYYRNEHHRVFPIKMGLANYPTSFYLEGAMHSLGKNAPYAIDARAFEDIPAPPPQNTFGRFIKGSDGYYWWHVSNPFDPTVYKFRIQNSSLPLFTPPIYPSNPSSAFLQTGNIYDMHTYDFNYSAPAGYQTFNYGFNKVITHRIYIFRTDGDLKRRYGITSGDPKCLFGMRLDTNRGAYINLVDIPSTPGTRSETAGTRAWGRVPFKKVKITCGKLDNKFGYYCPPPLTFDGWHSIPPSPWSSFVPPRDIPGSSDIHVPYLQSHADILNDVAGQIDSESNSLLTEFQVSDMPFTDILIGYPVGYPFFHVDPFTATDRQYIERILDMSPLFNLSGDFVYVCISYHDFYQEVNAPDSYTMMDIYNAHGVGPINFEVPLTDRGNGVYSMANSWEERFLFPSDGLSAPYNSQEGYLKWRIDNGILPSPYEHYWKLGDPVDIISKVALFTSPPLPMYTDGRVYR